MTLPNKISILRICLTPVFMFFLLSSWIPHHTIISLVIFAIASLSDSVDGHIARKYNLITVMGKFLDPLADKLLIIAALICMLSLGLVNPWYAMIIVSRELIITSFRIIAATMNVVMAADVWGKIKTLLQIIAIIATILEAAYLPNLHAAQYLMLIAVLLTVYSGIQYIAKNWNVIGDDK